MAFAGGGAALSISNFSTGRCVLRVAAIYDIHGNLPALEAVFGEIRGAGVDLIVVGGDVLPGPMPVETLSFLLDLDRPVEFIRGNGEVAVLAEMAGTQSSSLPEQARQVVRWTAQQLPPEQKRVIASWSATSALHTEGRALHTAGHALHTVGRAGSTATCADSSVTCAHSTANRTDSSAGCAR